MAESLRGRLPYAAAEPTVTVLEYPGELMTSGLFVTETLLPVLRSTPFLPFTTTALTTDDVGKEGEDAATTPAVCPWAIPCVATPGINIVVVGPAVSVMPAGTMFLAPVGTWEKTPAEFIPNDCGPATAIELGLLEGTATLGSFWVGGASADAFNGPFPPATNPLLPREG